MALRRPHKRMKMAWCRVGLSIVWWTLPSPLLLDSGRVFGYGARNCRNDGVGSPCGRRWWYRGWHSFAGC